MHQVLRYLSLANQRISSFQFYVTGRLKKLEQFLAEIKQWKEAEY